MMLLWQILLPLVGVALIFPLSDRFAKPIAFGFSLGGVVMAPE